MFDCGRDRAIDWPRVERWVNSLAAGDGVDVRAELGDRFDGQPTVLWNPRPNDLESEKLRFLLDYWNGLRRGGELPRITDIDPMRMRSALGHIMLVDVVDGGRDFRYRLYGTEIAFVSGFDMTGRHLSSHYASANVAEFTFAVYRAVLARKEPVFTSRKPVGARHTLQWQRLVMPLVDPTGAVVRLLACKLPISPSGAAASGH